MLVNIGLTWYLMPLLKKLFFISENISDLYLTFRSFSIFVKSLYGMNSFHGEPIIQELVERTQMVLEEIEMFREVFEYTLDEELEEEFDDIEENEENTRSAEAGTSEEPSTPEPQSSQPSSEDAKKNIKKASNATYYKKIREKLKQADAP